MSMDAIAAQNIWVSVLERVVRDLIRNHQRQSGETALAERWVGAYPSRDFRDVCAMAGLEPIPTHTWFRSLVDTPFDDRRALAQGFAHTLDVSPSRAAGRGRASERGRAA